VHALPSHPRHPLAAGAAAFLLALVVMAAAAPDLGTLDLSVVGGGDGDVAETYVAPAGAEAAPAGAPAWTQDPLAAPLQELAR
jgi:hypothetical protein